MFHNPIPAVHHTSREARVESKYEFFENDFLKGPVINYDADIFFINKWRDFSDF
jgi:hypothetical protein